MTESVIADLNADDQPEITEVESVCFNCYKNGITRILLTRIAFFREIIVSSFSCPHCGFENRTFDPASRIQDKGLRVTLKVQTACDLNRRIVRPAGSTVLIPELDASFPTSDGDLTTIEGVILRLADNIEQLQPERKKVQPGLASDLDAFLGKLRGLLSMEKPFTLVLDDPSGNGCIENIKAPNPDSQLEICLYERSAEQCAAIGLRADDDDANPPAISAAAPTQSSEGQSTEGSTHEKIGTDEVLTFKVNCPDCNAPCATNMKLIDIPHFKQVVIMATVCSSCGHKDSEVKSGGGVAAKGRRYRLKLTHVSDLSRDVLVSETAAVRLPDLELESMGGTLGGRFTTLEGLLLAVRDQLISANPFLLGDSSSAEEKTSKLATVIRQLKQIATGERLGVIFELKDPAGNSYLQNVYAPDSDPELEVVDYERSETENDELGLNDMNTTDYETVSTTKFGDTS
ncbi:hypothetical protein EG68_08031 [Paragonimus skrjabini miyazakii]|uniref:Zinc finger ZPR1-type domain-containing protein n=1 Tax=Paragonimus skrjabini miyazakii TaxID=59628 RepID=A0A8S9YJM3_9TREM|nr:hypothetical protein EG68_08031 [Paragonimus skrjabini miyazakii]